MNFLLTCCTFLAVMASTGATAQTTPDGNLENQDVRIELRLREDGTYEEIIDRTGLVADQAVLERWRDLQIRFRPDALDMTVTRVEVQKPDGRKQTLPVLRNASPAATGAALQFKIPSLQIGDVLSYQVKINHKVRLLDGRFSIGYNLQTYVPHPQTTLRVRIPAALSLKVAADGFDTRQESIEGDQRVITLRYQRTRPGPRNPDRIDELLNSPHLLISSFAGYPSLGQAMGRRFTQAAQVTSDIRAFAQRLVSERHTPRDKAAALYYWVNAHIVYDDSDIYADGVSPRPAGEILGRRKGDCKDHVVLLMALLRAAGIDSTPMLISTENNFTLPPVAVAQIFNHVILHIPSLHVYAEATHGALPFGVLPPYETGKPLVSLAADARISRTPQRTRQDASITETTLTLAADGAVRGEVKAEVRGTLVGEIRNIARELAPPRDAGAVRNALLAKGLATPEGTLRFSDDEIASVSRTHMLFRGDGALKTHGAGELIPVSYLRNSYALDRLAKLFAPEQDHGAFLCGARHVEENFVLEFPPGVNVSTLPSPASYADARREYTSNYVLERLSSGDRVHVTRRLLDDTPTAVCTATDYADFHRLAAVVARDMGAGIRYTHQ
ncbi:transglutaminase domain-containing protein [Janthinobacterium sp. PAMC25594]|uniref:transglutaminase domain-containing protein n=1 Tax=Janthinobacterium sp. PAMC25594 TaxID=2861284 RepID=UPI001C634125|nr:transglutaminase domain-containing protein [Janthinobacterium sp. PAMC25594]QYG08934.1 DUF3857 domain-containing protein [Janthinobacterium sp. PAMC25594]